MPSALPSTQKGVTPLDSSTQKHLTSLPAAPRWGEADGLDFIRIPASKPDVILFIRAESSYIKVFEISKEGEPLFGNGARAQDLAGAITKTFTEKVESLCRAPVEGAPGILTLKQTKAFTDMTKALETQTRAANIAVSTSLILAALFVLTFAINRSRGT